MQQQAQSVYRQLQLAVSQAITEPATEQAEAAAPAAAEPSAAGSAEAAPSQAAQLAAVANPDAVPAPVEAAAALAPKPVGRERPGSRSSRFMAFVSASQVRPTSSQTSSHQSVCGVAIMCGMLAHGSFASLHLAVGRATWLQKLAPS